MALSVIERKVSVRRTGGMDPLLPLAQDHIDEQVTKRLSPSLNGWTKATGR